MGKKKAPSLNQTAFGDGAFNILKSGFVPIVPRSFNPEGQCKALAFVGVPVVPDVPVISFVYSELIQHVLSSIKALKFFLKKKAHF